MWNPFRRVELKPIFPKKTTKPALGPETEDPTYSKELKMLKSRSLVAQQQITMIHEHLASSALRHVRGEKICHD